MLMIAIFPKIMMTKMMKMKMIMMMMIITGTFFNNTEKTISSILRPVARKNPCDLCIERFSLDCRKTKTKVNTLANQRA